MSEWARAGLLALALVTIAWANGGGIILTPPADFALVAAGSVETLLAGVHVRHAVEQDGALWVATDRGVAYRAAGAREFSWLDAASRRLPSDATARVARFHGDTWVGLAAGDPQRQVSVVRLSAAGYQAFGAAEGLPGDEVVDLVAQVERLWALTSAGLFVLEGSRFVPAPAGAQAPRGQVTAIAAGFDGKLYAGTDQTDVGVWDGAAWTRHAFANRVVGRVIRCVSVGVGHIWFGTFGSLNDYTPQTQRLDDETVEKAVLFPSRIMVALAGNAELMLTATSGGGLYRFDRPASWRLYSDTNGLPSISIESVTLAWPHALVATAAGLARIDLSKPLPVLAKPSPRPSAAPAAIVASQTTSAGALPAALSPLASTGRALLEVPALLGARGFTCVTCHKGLWGNPAFTSPTGGPGTVDLTSAFTAPSAEDRTSNPRKIPHLFGLRYRAPFPSGGAAASLREYLRAHIVRDFEGPEPSAAALDALEVYLLDLEVPPAPGLREDGALLVHVGGAARRGEAVFRRPFETLGQRACATCHVPAEHFTDNRLHLRPDGRHVRTPTLLGLARAAPYLSDGSRRTLPDVVAYYNDAYHLQLKRGDVEDLVAYLATVGEVAP